MIYLKLFLTFLKIGAFTFGGGYAMLPLIQEAAVQNRWMSEEQLVNFIAVSESTPGPFAVNISTYIGAELAGLPGALVSTLGVILPSFIIILAVARFFMRFNENRTVKGCMNGLRPAVVGMISAAAVSIGKSVFFADGITLQALKTPEFIISVSVFAVMFAASLKKLHPIIIITASAAAGIACGYAFL